MIFGGPREVRNGQHVRDRYSQKAKKLPQTVVHTADSEPPKGHTPQPDDIIFTEADASWAHNPYEDALVITVEVANSLIHRLLVDSGTAINILCWGAYQKTGLRLADLTLMTFPLYGFTGDILILEGTIKLAVTLGEPPRMTTVMIDFLTVKCLSAFNRVLGRLLLKALKVVTLNHCLTMKCLTTKGIGHVLGKQCDSRECYSKSLELDKMGPELPQAMEVEKIS